MKEMNLEAVVNDMEYFLSEEGMAEWITDLINGVHTVEDLRQEFYEWQGSAKNNFK